MPNDTAHNAFGNLTPNKAALQDTAISYNCSHCVLIFKTRIYLYEHLHQVHGLSVDSALRDSGLKSVPQIKSKPDNSLRLGKSKPDSSLKLGKSKTDNGLKLRKTDFAFNCKNCNFKSGNWSIYCEHKQQCSGRPNYENHTAKSSFLINTHKASTSTKEANLKSTSTDGKNYSTSPQTITKYFAPSSTMKSDCAPYKRNTKTLRLEESPLSSSGVFQVTAASIDLAQASMSSSSSHLLSDLDRISDPTSAKPVDLFKEAPPKNDGKRMAKEAAESTPSKKTKLELEAPIVKLKTSTGELSFEVSDDEEKPDLVSGVLKTIKEYFCKHCQYNTLDLMHLVSHYEDDHPYIKCNSVYIEEKSDQTAMFRCLECPVEFSSEAYLRNHYSEDHPEAPEIGSLKLVDLVHKCFVCPFTSKILQSLKEHYKEKHPSQKVKNSLWYFKYSSPRHDDYVRISEENKSPEKHESERATTASQDEGMADAPKSHDGALYFCGKCPFSHKSVVVLHVHYKKCHPEEPITLDQIKQLVPPGRASEEKPGPEQNISHSFKMEESWASPISDPEDEDISFNYNVQATSHATDLDNAASSPVEKMFFCRHCTFSNSNIKSVVSHHNAKHGMTTTIEEILHHTAEVQSKTVLAVHNSETNLYADPQDLYYCKICNYGNLTLLGILGHQNKLHSICVGKDSVLEYTAMIRDQIEKSKSHPNDFILPSGLPLPLVKGDTALFFCHLCNYKHKDLHVLSGHYVKSHKSFRRTPQQIAEYSSMVSERLNASSRIISSQENQKVTAANTPKKSKMKTTNIKLGTEPKTEAKLRCIQCSYGTNHLYRIRKHLQANHKNTLSLSDIVQLCGTEATFQPGYHCDVCPFWHEDLRVVRGHCMDKHERSISDHKLSSFMYLSPDICDPKTRGSALNSIITDVKKESSKVPDHDDDDGANGDEKDFDSYQVPLEFDNLNVSTEEAKEYSCTFCSAKFEGRGGLLIHMGMKHRDEVSDEMPQLEMAERTQAFKCHNCSYVNNIKQGVIAHSLMKHPNKALKLYNIYVESRHLKNVQMKVKNGTWKFCGYMCKDCSQVYPSKEKMKSHRETHKQQAVESKNDEEIWCQHCGLYCSSANEHTDHLRVCQKNGSSSIFRCVLCRDAFITKVRLGIHYTKKHGKAAFFKHYAPLYNQPSMDRKATAVLPAQPTRPTKSETVLMYKCPSCRYVNSSFHGTLTHCQMRHPQIVVRAGKLKTIELDSANMIGCLAEKAKNFGGYRCRKCPLVYGGLKKLKKHCEIDHNPSAQATSQYHAMSEAATSGQSSLVSKFRHFFKCSLCSYSTSILKQLGNHYMQRHGKSSYVKFYSPLFHQANKPKMPFKHEEIEQTKDTLEEAESEVKTTIPQVYKCNACSYGSPYRRYLISHFKNRHKYDSQAVNKHMEKYKDYKSTLPSGQYPCKKCHSVLFESKGRLLAHYQTFHISEIQTDLIILAERTDRTTGVFRCNYCKKKVYGIKNICKHLDQHRARWLKKGKKSESKVFEENALPSLDPHEDETGLNVPGEETVVSPSASATSSLDPDVPEVSEEEPSDVIPTCQRCKRSFKSLKGLRSHERSHAALAALDNATALDSQEHIDQYLIYRTGTTRPFMCTFCPYRTSVLSLGKNHVMKNHSHVLNSAEAHQHLDEATQKDDASQNCVDDMNADYDEPENSYLEPPDVQRQLKHYNVMAQIDPGSKIKNIQISDPRMLPCEMCNFNCQHYSAMRRHYLRRHGKKLVRCKDCNFFSCFKQNLDLHEQMGHSTLQSEPTHQKNLCCPFCLYQSKNKNNMIDHIVLHREERVMPIEVRRSKLSRYLQGIVFRCHKCTFTCGNADSLHLHMLKHNDLKPFKCRLCYFDCTQLRELEAHLCDKHQVVRNHQLVGHVSLDQLLAEEGRISQDDEDDELLDEPENYEQTMKKNQNEDQAEDAEDGHSDPDSPKIQSILGQSVDERFKAHANYTNDEHNDDQAQIKSTDDISEEPKIQSVPGQSLDESFKNRMNDKNERNDNQAQIKASGCVSESSPVCIDDQDESQDNSKNMETSVESGRQNVNNSTVDYVAAVGSNQDSKTKLEMQNPLPEKMSDSSRNDLILPSLAKHAKSQKVQKDQHKMNSSEEKSPYGEMPILEKYFKEQCLVFAQPGETSEKLPGSDMREDRNKGRSEVSNTAHNSPPVLLATVHSPVAANMFPCDLCGRSLANTSDLERHMMRHGM